MGALIVPTHLCEWGAAPSDQSHLQHKKGQWTLVLVGLYLHAPLRGTRAQVCPFRVCRGWAVAIQAAYQGYCFQVVRT